MARQRVRVLLAAPSFHDWDLGAYLLAELAARGVASTGYAYREAVSDEEANLGLLGAVERFRPSVLLGLKLGRIAPGTLAAIRRRGVPVALWYVDCFDATVPDQIRRLLSECDVFMTSACGMIPEYQRLTRAPVHWVHEGVHLPAFRATSLPAAQRATYASEVAFVGNVLHPPVADRSLAERRLRLLRRIARIYDLKVWGPQGDVDTRRRWRGVPGKLIEWPAYNRELVKICGAARMVLGLNTINSVERYFSNRTFLTLAAGGFHVTHYVPGLERMFHNHEHLVWFEDDDECLELLAHYRRRPRQRARIAAQGRRWTRRRYSMSRQVGRIMEILDDAG